MKLMILSRLNPSDEMHPIEMTHQDLDRAGFLVQQNLDNRDSWRPFSNVWLEGNDVDDYIENHTVSYFDEQKYIRSELNEALSAVNDLIFQHTNYVEDQNLVEHIAMKNSLLNTKVSILLALKEK